MTHRTHESAADKLAAWQAAQAELAALERELSAAMTQYAQTLGEPPRHLLIAIERKREQVGGFFDIAMEAIDAQSSARTGHTNFGNLS